MTNPDNEVAQAGSPITCPVHGIPDCSPLLNGCSLVIRAHQERGD